jgi:hypothetical protein
MHSRYAEPLNVAHCGGDLDERFRISSQFQGSDRQLSAAVSEIGSASQGPCADSARWARGLRRIEFGYESASQFSREFKRFFGNRPMEESKRIRERFAAARTLQIAPSPLVGG